MTPERPSTPERRRGVVSILFVFRDHADAGVAGAALTLGLLVGGSGYLAEAFLQDGASAAS